MSSRFACLILAASMAATPAFADSWKDESGKGREWKQEYRDGNCKIERKWERSGEYKEEVKCDGRHWGYTKPPVIVYRAPVTGYVEFPAMPGGPNYGEVYRDERGRYCREYQTTGIIDGRQQALYGTVCLQPDGTWSFNN